MAKWLPIREKDGQFIAEHDNRPEHKGIDTHFFETKKEAQKFIKKNKKYTPMLVAAKQNIAEDS